MGEPIPVGISFSITQWAAWAPGLATPEAWKAWASATPRSPLGDETPPLSEVPAMVRRRIERLGRPAFQAAQWCEGELRGLPLIFASRHGDPGRTAALLSSMVAQEPLSPTSFALSVHNAIGAQYSIIRHDVANVSAIANGLFTVEAALIEAAGLWSDGHSEVMVVAYDASPHQLYAAQYEEPAADFAFALRLRPGSDFTLEAAPAAAAAAVLPHSLEVLRFLLGAEATLHRGDGTVGWRWSRRG